jgi:GNAT superfamily N-acetyltransferase
VGIQIDAFDKSPFIMMSYNPDYYRFLLEDSCGYEKSMDLYCYYVDEESMSEKLKRAAEAIRKRTKLRYRKFDKKHFWRDAMKIWEVYNKAWEKNWLAVPFTEAEFKQLANNLKQIADYDIIFFAEDDNDRLVGFSLALPNINEAIIKIRNGRLFPFGLPKLLWHTRKGAIKSVRIMIMGVLEEYRSKGVDAVFYYDSYIEGMKKGYNFGEIGWILETNTMMNRAAEMMGAKRYKTYRMYVKKL